MKHNAFSLSYTLNAICRIVLVLPLKSVLTNVESIEGLNMLYGRGINL
jgi:hypothetical protein